MIKLTSRRNAKVKREVMKLIFLGLGFLLISSCIQTESHIEEEGREISDFVFLEYGLTSKEIVNVVGPPDVPLGFGIKYYGYLLKDGRRLGLQFDTHDELEHVFIVSIDGLRQTIELPIK